MFKYLIGRVAKLDICAFCQESKGVQPLTDLFSNLNVKDNYEIYFLKITRANVFQNLKSYFFQPCAI